MRGIVGLIVTLVIALIVGVGAYNLGVAQGVATSGTAVAAPAVYYHPFFFGGFGVLFPLPFFILPLPLPPRAFWGRPGPPYRAPRPPAPPGAPPRPPREGAQKAPRQAPPPARAPPAPP